MLLVEEKEDIRDYSVMKTFSHQHCDIGIKIPTNLQITREVILICWEAAFDFLVNNGVAFKAIIHAFF